MTFPENSILGEDAQGTLSESDTNVEEPARSDSSAQFSSTIANFKRPGFVLLNVWLLFHLFAIVICPLSVEPSSSVERSLYRIASPYLQLLNLDHGYHYFVPDPGSSTLVDYKLEFVDGSTSTGRFPTRSIVPRLYYHRHFMLTEFLGNGPEELQPFVERAFARNLCRTTGAVRVSLTQIEHQTASTEDIQKGLTLNDPSFFKETSLGTYTAEELQLPMKRGLNEDQVVLIEASLRHHARKESP